MKILDLDLIQSGPILDPTTYRMMLKLISYQYQLNHLNHFIMVMLCYVMLWYALHCTGSDSDPYSYSFRSLGTCSETFNF